MLNHAQDHARDGEHRENRCHRAKRHGKEADGERNSILQGRQVFAPSSNLSNSTP